MNPFRVVVGCATLTLCAANAALGQSGPGGDVPFTQPCAEVFLFCGSEQPVILDWECPDNFDGTIHCCYIEVIQEPEGCVDDVLLGCCTIN
jgi:hypothetical protein